MKFSTIRHSLFTVHMWVGLILGVLCAILGLTGSFLVYDNAAVAAMNPPPPALTAGAPLPVAMIADAARGAARSQDFAPGQLRITLPDKPREAALVSVSKATAEGTAPRRRGPTLQVYVDPVSGQVLDTRTGGMGPVRGFMHQLHGTFMLGLEGRRILIGGLGVAMLMLGVSGLVLWWPKRGQWKYAFFVRRTAKGLRFHRELHAATGIWIFVIYMLVSYSGLVLSWPQWLGPERARPAPQLTAGTNAPIGPDRALMLAGQAMPGRTPDSVTIPERLTQPMTVGFLTRDAVRSDVLVDPWTDKVIDVRDNSGNWLAWMRPLHEGAGAGLIFQFLVFLSGLVPALFVVTGIIMWAKKRRRRVPMTATIEELGEEAEGGMA